MTGGYVYIYHSQEMPYAWKNDDGYQWSEILHQMDMLTAKGLEILNSETIGGRRRGTTICHDTIESVFVGNMKVQ